MDTLFFKLMLLLLLLLLGLRQGIMLYNVFQTARRIMVVNIIFLSIKVMCHVIIFEQPKNVLIQLFNNQINKNIYPILPFLISL